MDHGSCQYRLRAFIVAIRKDCKRGKFKWPKKRATRPKASLFLDAPTKNEVPALPAPRSHPSPKEHNRARELAKGYVRRWMAKGVSPKRSLIVGDVGCSKTRPSSRDEEAPALTARRASHRDMWLSIYGRNAHIHEMFKWQTHRSLEQEFPNWRKTISESGMGTAIGNSLHAPTVAAILQKVIKHSNLQEVQI